jgi:alpha-1,6-mannosyltransferase
VVFAAPQLGRRWLRGLIVGAVVLFALAPPLLSLDVFSYISYGSLQVEDLNPYENPPSAIPEDEAAQRVEDYRDAVSVYGPVFTLVSHPLAAAGTSFALWALKAIAALSALGLAALSARLASARGVSPERAAAFVGLNPLLLVHGVGGAHNDLLMALGMTACAWLLVSSRMGASGAMAVATVAVKAAGGLIAPFAILGARGAQARTRWTAGALAAAAVIGGVSLAVYGTAATEAFDVLGGSQEKISRYSLPATLSRATGIDLGAVRAVAIVLFAALVLWWLWRVARGEDWIRGAAWAALGLLLATAYVTPWYIVWALPLVAVSRDRVLIGMTLAMCAFQLVNAIPL